MPLGASIDGFGASVWRPFEMRVRESDLEGAKAILAPYLEADEGTYEREGEPENDIEEGS